jgi:hypothetical protein
MNGQILQELDRGTEGLLPQDLHWVLQPATNVLWYDLLVKAQWLESIALSREPYTSCRELTHVSMRNEREFMEKWLSARTH